MVFLLFQKKINKGNNIDIKRHNRFTDEGIYK